MNDLKNVKLRVMQNPIFIEMFNVFGAQAMPLPFAELYAAMESKKVDGQENPVNTIQSCKFYEVQKYLSLTKHVYSPWIVTAGKKWWDALSSQERQAIMASAVASRQYEREDSRQSAEKAMTFLKDAGMKINVVDAKEINKMRDAIQGVVAKTAYGPQLQRIKSLLQR